MDKSFVSDDAEPKEPQSKKRKRKKHDYSKDKDSLLAADDEEDRGIWGPASKVRPS